MKNQVKYAVHIALLLACGAGFAVSAWAEREESVRRYRHNEGRKYAVIIGINGYEDAGILDLQCAVNDAKAVYQLLQSAPGGFTADNMILITDEAGQGRRPTRGVILRFLKSFIALAGEKDTILVYFAGHGIAVEGRLFLLPADASLSVVEESAIAYATLMSMLEESPAKRKVMLLDACHSGMGRSVNTLKESDFARLEQESQGILALASCGPDELSYEMDKTGHGAFTFFLLKGLTGKADADGDGLIGASELSRYVWEQTRHWAAQNGLTQTPWRMERVAGDIILARAGAELPPSLRNASAAWDAAAPTPSGNAANAGPAPVPRPDPLWTNLSGRWRWASPFEFDGGRLSFEAVTLEQHGGALTIQYLNPRHPIGPINVAHMEAAYQDGALKGRFQVNYRTGNLIPRTVVEEVSFELKLHEDGNVLAGSAFGRIEAPGFPFTASRSAQQDVRWVRQP